MKFRLKKTCKKYRLRRNVNSRHPYTSWTTKPHVVLSLHWLLVTAKGLWLLRSTYPGFTESASFPKKICLLPYFLLGLVLLTFDAPKFHFMKVFSIRLQRVRNSYGNAKSLRKGKGKECHPWWKNSWLGGERFKVACLIQSRLMRIQLQILRNNVLCSLSSIIE